MNDLETYCKLHFGNFHLFYKNGAVRMVSYNQFELIRGIYPAVRDKNWGTVSMEIIDEKMEMLDNSFNISIKANFKKDPIHFTANINISGKEEGSLLYRFKGEANSNFLKNRIGINLLFPVNGYAGNRFKITTPDGHNEIRTFPDNISPHQPAVDIQNIHWKVNNNHFKINLEGDVFEMEDQRNWTDASYKVYSTPLALPFPAEIKKGDNVSQKLEFQSDIASTLSTKADPTIMLKLNTEKDHFMMPDIGFCERPGEGLLSNKEISVLRELRAKHYRTDIHLNKAGWQEKLDVAAKNASKLTLALYLVLHLPDSFEDELTTFIHFLNKNRIIPTYIALFEEKARITTPELNKAVTLIKTSFPGIQTGAGVDSYFAELNRTLPPAAEFDFVTYSICPQVHAFDNLSLIENLEAQQDTVLSAKQLYGGKPVHISPVTLQQRFNVVATEEEPALAYPADPRQHSFFNALWTLISVKYLAESDATLITYFENIGAKGLIPELSPEKTENSGLQALLYPVYHMLKFVLSFRFVRKVTSSDPVNVDAICLQNEGQVSLMLVNFSTDEKTVIVKDFVQKEPVKNILIKTMTHLHVHEEIASLPYKKMYLEKNTKLNLSPASITIIESYNV